MKYIGQHRYNPNKPDKYIGSGRNFTKAVKEFGKDNFSKEIIGWAYTQEELDQLEIKAIDSAGAVSSNEYYNIAPGGFVHEQSPETRYKISKTLTGIKRSDETKKKMSECKKRENLSEETRRKLSETSKGRKHSEESIEKMRQKKIGTKLSDETKRKLSESKRGKKKSEEAKAHMSAAQKGHPKYPNSGCPSVRIRCIETGEEYESIHEADRKTGIDYRNLSAHLKGRVKSLKGLHFEVIQN